MGKPVKVFFIDRSKLLICITLIFLMTLVFYSNILYQNDGGFFDNFQLDSEGLVIEAVNADRFGISTNRWGLGRVDEAAGTFGAYTSSYGLQGRVFSFLYHTVGFSSFSFLRFACCAALAATLFPLCILLEKRYGRLFGSVFFFVFLLSPWVTAMARNLYWVEFLMFLPAVLVLWLLDRIERQRSWRFILVLIFLASWIRNLCGYEFVSSIFLFAVAVPACELLLERDCLRRKRLFGVFCLISAALLAGFCFAYIIHANLFSGNLLDGMKAVWDNVAMKRLVGGDAMNYEHPLIKASLLASPLEVVRKYLYFMSTPIIPGVPGSLFPILIIISFCMASYRCFRKKPAASRDAVLLCTFLLVPFSWYILSQGHSYIHTTINSVLLYFGFVPMCFYVIVRQLADIWAFVTERKQAAAITALPKKAIYIGCFISIACILLLHLCSARQILLYNNKTEATRALEMGDLLYQDIDTQVVLFEQSLYVFEQKFTRTPQAYFVHLTPVNADELPEGRNVHGFDNYDFSFPAVALQLSDFYPYEVARRALPAYEISSITFGQFNRENQLWRASADIVK